MAKFLNTRKAVSEMTDLIRDAGQTLILISPFLKLSKEFQDLLTYRNKKDKITTIIFREQALKIDELSFLEELRFVKLLSNESVHAKCYVSDEKMIITSLNLYESSMANNKEMGVIIDKSNPNDKELWDEAYKEVDYIRETSKEFKYSTKTTTSSTPVYKSSNTKENNNSRKIDQATAQGYCIRTGIQIPFNIEKPLCYDAYKSWNKYGDIDYPEKFCHFSGEPSDGKTSVAKPILSKNWKKAKEIFDLEEY